MTTTTTTTTATEPRQVVLAWPRPITLAAVAIGVIPFAIHAWMAFNGYFGHDDFVILHRAAAHGPFDLDYLFQDYSGHLAPGMFLLAWFITAVAPLSANSSVSVKSTSTRSRKTPNPSMARRSGRTVGS